MKKKSLEKILLEGIGVMTRLERFKKSHQEVQQKTVRVPLEMYRDFETKILNEYDLNFNEAIVALIQLELEEYEKEKKQKRVKKESKNDSLKDSSKETKKRKRKNGGKRKKVEA
jgi:hypothetical protein